jgi:hypothetical protein
LGDELCANPIVTDSKLTNEESLFFEQEITVQELDAAIQQINSKSAGGSDGISTIFLRQFWNFFRKPFTLYANHCFGNGTISPMFNSASIRLIPKKGDTKLLKNWRPISLLNVGFKIISKAIDNRLKKMSDVILLRAQKGFTNKRNIQECLMNIINSIEHCESTKLPSFVLALDMAKAFDTVRHDYMDLVYKFFGIGNNMINMIKTVSTGRTASIILEDGSLSQPIKLGTGFPQGNPPSPNQFNFGAQILIFRI